MQIAARLGDVGNECVIVVAGSEVPLKSARDLKTEGERRVSVGPSDSGSAVTHRYSTRESGRLPAPGDPVRRPAQPEAARRQ